MATRNKFSQEEVSALTQFFVLNAEVLQGKSPEGVLAIMAEKLDDEALSKKVTAEKVVQIAGWTGVQLSDGKPLKDSNASRHRLKVLCRVLLRLLNTIGPEEFASEIEEVEEAYRQIGWKKNRNEEGDSTDG